MVFHLGSCFGETEDGAWTKETQFLIPELWMFFEW